ncbi:hypothetical protein D3C80_1817340 [compost metagenome]
MSFSEDDVEYMAIEISLNFGFDLISFKHSIPLLQGMFKSKNRICGKMVSGASR